MNHKNYSILLAIFLISCNVKQENNASTVSTSFDKLNVVRTDKAIACKLTSEELRERKAGAIASLKNKIQETIETEHGYAFRFAGSNETLGELMVFIQSERTCCEFFTFKLGIQDASSPIWLEISGAEGTKSFIKEEMGFL